MISCAQFLSNAVIDGRNRDVEFSLATPSVFQLKYLTSGNLQVCPLLTHK